MAGFLGSPLLRNLAAERSQNLSIITGYAILGFTNIILPSIIFSACYLIIPYSRPTVTVILVLPALVAKIAIPHVLPDIPWTLRPIWLAALWAVAAIIAALTPPGVHPALRILCAALASVTAAAAEASCLGHLRRFGRPGLAGWCIGTGAGASAWAVAPYLLTGNLRMTLRGCLWYVIHLVSAMLFAYYVFLRHPPAVRSPSPDNDVIKFDAAAAEPGNVFAVWEPTYRAKTVYGRVKQNSKLTSKLIRPYIRPLLYSFALQTLVAPGMSRAYAKSNAFGSFDSFYAAYNLAFHAGSFVSRSAIMVHRVHKLRRVTSALTIVTGLVVINAISGAITSPVVLLPALFVAGLLGGAVYAIVYATAVEQTTNEHVDDAQYMLGVIGTGETMGILLGTLFGSLIEGGFCAVDRGTGLRWCYSDAL